MKHNWKRMLSFVLSVALVFSLLVPMAGAEGKDDARLQRIELEPVDASTEELLLGKPIEEDFELPKEEHKLTDRVRVSIVLEQASTIDVGFGLEKIAYNAAARSYRDGLKAEQDALTARIEAATGKALQVKWNLTLAANMISADVLYADIETIKAVDGVADVFLENRYDPDLTSPRDSGGDKPATGPSSGMIGSSLAWAQGYTGAGSKVAIIDTGADIEHMSFSGEGLEYALATDGLTPDLMTAEDVSALSAQLNSGAGSQAYISAKIPYGYNYVDNGYDVTHVNDTQEEHGSHVAGIAAANRYVYVDEEWKDALTTVGVQGAAPDAQLLVMKVFGKNGGAYDSDYFAAIEDAIVMGCDSANLSLGSGSPGFAFSQGYQDVMDSLLEHGLVVAFSAGNSGMWYDTPYNNSMYSYLYSDDVNYATNGSPGSFSNSLTTASADNAGQTGHPLLFNGNESPVFYTETSGYGNKPFTSLIGETYEYVLVDGPGVDDNEMIGDVEHDQFAALGAEILEGKIAICQRGTSSFFAKANAAVAQGAVGVIIYNNQGGTINMNLTGYSYDAPVVSILQADGLAILSGSEEHEGYYTGTMSVSSDMVIQMADISDAHVTISSFSSFGPNGTLELKPEITAPGGGIYSVQGQFKSRETGEVTGDHDTYELMSGTSMASPQVAGMAAVMAQYIRDNDLEAKTGLSKRQLTNSLLMSTAVPILDEYDEFWPTFRQGAGLANVNNAVSATSYILMDESSTIFATTANDGKVKAELGDDSTFVGAYSYSFTVNPLPDENGDYPTKEYTLRTELFTQGLAGDGGYGYLADPGTATLSEMMAVFDLSGRGFEVSYTVDGNELNEGDSFTVSDQPVQVDVSFELDSTLVLYMWWYLAEGGFFVEGFTFVEPVSGGEGAFPDVNHSIPILGFCGSWSDPSMFDRSSVIDDAYGTGKLPYITADTNYMTVKDADGRETVYMGNPYMVEEVFPEYRLAMRSDATINKFNYLNIRNISTLGFTVQDEDGKFLFVKTSPVEKYSAYYHVNQGTWMNTAPSNYSVGKSLSGLALKEGEDITLSFYGLPEYYGRENGGHLDNEGLIAAIENEEIGDGSTISYTVTIDDTAPVVDGLYLDLLNNNMLVKAQDNNYIAYIAITNRSGSRVYTELVPPQENAGEAVEVALTPGSLPATAMLVVADYAGNAYTAVFHTGGSTADSVGRVIGFVSSNTSTAPGTGNRAWEIDPAALSYDHSSGAYSGINVAANLDIDVRAAEFVNGYVFMAASDGYLYAADISDLGEPTAVGKYTDVTEAIYDMAYSQKHRTLFALGEDNIIYSVDLQSGKLQPAVEVILDGKANKLAIDNGGVFYVAGEGGTSTSRLYRMTPALPIQGVPDSGAQQGPVYADTGSFDFEVNPTSNGWTFVDADGDGANWYYVDGNTDTYSGLASYAYDGVCFITSASYTNAALTPDNWAISPAFNLSEESALTLSLWARGQDASWAGEVFALYAGTSSNPEKMTKISEDFTATGSYENYTADLTAFAGEDTVYVAVRHYNVTDMFRLNVDLVQILDGNGDVVVPGPAPEPEEEPEEEPEAVEVEPQMVGALGVYNYSYGGAMTWNSEIGALYLVSNWNSTQDYDHYLWIVNPETAESRRCNEIGGTELNSSNTSGRLYAAVSGLFIVPGSSGTIDTAEEPTGIDVEPSELTMLRGQSVTLSPRIYPWTLEDKRVTFKSADETVATVDGSGVVTGVGVGETTITVTTVAKPSFSAEVAVSVVEAPVAELRGVIWDETGKGWASVFNSNDTENWTGLGEVGELVWGALVDDKVYASTQDTMYAFDADTYELTEYGSIVSMWIPSDAIELPVDFVEAFAEMGYHVGQVLGPVNNGTYLAMLDPEDSSVLYFDLSDDGFAEDPLAVIAGTQTRVAYEGDDNCLVFYILTESGMAWRFIMDHGGSIYWEALGETGIDLSGVSDPSNEVWSSMVYDEESEYLFLSLYNGKDDQAHLYAIDSNDLSVCAELGSFRNKVWPVTGLYQYTPATDLLLKVSEDAVTLYESETMQLNIKVKLGETNGYTVESSDDSVATVDENGLITAVAEGVCTVTVTTVDRNDQGEQLTHEIAVTVKPLSPIKNFQMIGQISNQENGNGFGYVSMDDLDYSIVAEAPFAAMSASLTGDTYMMGDANRIVALSSDDFATETGYEFDQSTWSTYPAMDIANYPIFRDQNERLDESKALFTTEVGWVVTPDLSGWNLSSAIPDMAGIALTGVFSLPYLPVGDVNQDGQIDEADAQAILDYLTGENDGSTYDLAAADVDLDGNITTVDAGLILDAVDEGIANKNHYYYVYLILSQSGILYELDIEYEAGKLAGLTPLLNTGITLTNQSDASMTYIEADTDNDEEIDTVGAIVADNGSKKVWFIDLLHKDSKDRVGLIGTIDADNIAGLIGAYDGLVSVAEPDPYQDAEVLTGFYFEEEADVDAWTFIDADEDGYNWEWNHNIESWFTSEPDFDAMAMEGTGSILSGSYINTAGELTPDNWAVSPAIDLSGEEAPLLSVYAKGYDPDYAKERFALYAGTSSDISEMTMLTGYFIVSGGWKRYTADLSAFAGESEVYVAIRHSNITDMYLLDVDNVEILDGTNVLIEKEPGETVLPSAPLFRPKDIGLSYARLDSSTASVAGMEKQSPIDRGELASESVKPGEKFISADKGVPTAAPDSAALDEEQTNNTDTMAVVLTEDMITVNGLMTVDYDSEILSLVSEQSDLTYYSLHDDGNGLIKFAYASVNPIPAKTPLDTLKFGFTFDAEDGFKAIVSVKTIERNNKLDLDEDATDVELSIYSNAVWSWAEDYSSASATFKVPGEEDVVLDATVALDEDHSYPATCETDGLNVWTGTVVGPDGETYTDTQNEILAATGHAWDFAEENGVVWAEDYSSVTVNMVCANDPTHTCTGSTEEVSVEYVPAPTCTEAGAANYDAYVSIDQPEFYSEGELVPIYVGYYNVTVPATGHSYGEPVWTWSEDGSMAVATFTCAQGDSVVEKSAMSVLDTDTSFAPTCTEAGENNYVATVQFNGATYSDIFTVSVEATGHAWDEEWNWAEDFSSASVTITCQNDPTHTETLEAEVELSDQEDATCTEPGYYFYWADAEYEGEFFYDWRTVEPEATGHTWSEPTWEWTWNWDWSEVTIKAIFTCEVCEETVEFVIPSDTLDNELNPPTCTEPGEAVMIASVEFNDQTWTDSKTIPLNAQGHVWGDPVWNWSDDHTSATAGFTCLTDPSHVENLEATVVTETHDATCTEAGMIIYTASVELDGELIVDVQIVEIEALSHNFGDWIVLAPATCETNGVEAHYCSRCGASETRPITATDHSWGEVSYVWSYDNATVTATRICATCGKYEVETVSATAETTEPSCTEAGQTVYTSAAFTNEAFEAQTTTVVLPAAGHSYGEPEWTWSKDYKSASAKFVCAEGDDEQTVEATVSSVKTGNTTVYTATVEFNGETFTDDKSVETHIIVTEPTEPTEPQQPDEPGDEDIYRFVDVQDPNSWYYNAVNWAADNGIASGVDETHFEPNMDCTRAMMVTFIWRMAGSPEPKSTECQFEDVSADDEFFKAVVWAAEVGVVKGVSETLFAPERTVTRGQTVALLFRYAKAEAVTSVSQFTDVQESDYYFDAVNWAAAKEIVKGITETLFAPNNTCKRSEIVTFLYRFNQQ